MSVLRWRGRLASRTRSPSGGHCVHGLDHTATSFCFTTWQPSVEQATQALPRRHHRHHHLRHHHLHRSTISAWGPDQGLRENRGLLVGPGVVCRGPRQGGSSGFSKSGAMTLPVALYSLVTLAHLRLPHFCQQFPSHFSRSFLVDPVVDVRLARPQNGAPPRWMWRDLLRLVNFAHHPKVRARRS